MMFRCIWNHQGRICMVMLLMMVTALPVFAIEEYYPTNGFQGRPTLNNLFNPTGYTLHEREFEIGIGPTAFGVTDQVQIETNILLWLLQVYNAGVKVSLIEDENRAIAFGVGAAKLELPLEDDDDDGEFTSVSAYAVTTVRMSEHTMCHVGARYVDFNSDAHDEDDIDLDGSLSGSSIFAGLEHSLSNRTKFLADAGYDHTFDGYRFGGGVLFGWSKFRLKLGVSYFTAGDGFVWPNIGFRWRFWG